MPPVQAGPEGAKIEPGVRRLWMSGGLGEVWATATAAAKADRIDRARDLVVDITSILFQHIDAPGYQIALVYGREARAVAAVAALVTFLVDRTRASSRILSQTSFLLQALQGEWFVLRASSSGSTALVCLKSETSSRRASYVLASG